MTFCVFAQIQEYNLRVWVETSSYTAWWVYLFFLGFQQMITRRGPGNKAIPNCYNRADDKLTVKLDKLAVQSQMKTFS